MEGAGGVSLWTPGKSFSRIGVSPCGEPASGLDGWDQGHASFARSDPHRRERLHGGRPVAGADVAWLVRPRGNCQSGAPALDGAALPANYDQLQGGREGQSGRQAHRLDPDGLGQGLCIALLAPIGSHRTSVRPHRNLPRFGGWASIRRALWIEAALAIDAPSSGRG
jgi:hypothetical protein